MRRSRCRRPSRLTKRAVSLEIARARQDEIGPAGGEPAEHRDHDRRLGLLGERADVLVRRRLVARHHEQPDRVRRLRLLVAAGGPGVGDSAAVRSLGKVEGAAARAVGEPELLRELRDGRTAAAAGTAPDEDDALRLGDGRVVRVVEDPGAVAAGRLDPEVDDRRALDHRHVAEHDDDVGVADRREWEPVGVERAGDLLRQHRLVGVEPDAQQLAERVRLLDRLGAREHRDDPPARLAQQPLGLVERLLPRHGLETAQADALQRLAEPVLGVQVRVREAALVADPALVDLGVVAGEDPLDLALAHRRVDVAADGAEAADGRHVDDLPRPPLEAVLRRQERADRAELGHVAGERARVGQVLEGRDHRRSRRGWRRRAGRPPRRSSLKRVQR